MSTPPEKITRSSHAPDGARPRDKGNEHDTASPEELRGEIERTRADMSETIEAIQERLTPRSLVSQARASVATAAAERSKQARTLASGARIWAGDVALVTGEQAQYQARQVQDWCDRTRQQYPWLPSALVAGAAALLGSLALVAWRRASGRR